MKKFFATAVAGSLLFGSTAAVADTRPQVTRFSQPVAAAEANQDVAEQGLIFWLLAAGFSAAVIWALIELLKDNSPNRR